MEVTFSDAFKKAFKKRIAETSSEQIFWNKLEIFIVDPHDYRLKTHKLSGKLKSLWSFSVEYDVRVLFYFTKDKPPKAIFVKVGSHDEVY